MSTKISHSGIVERIDGDCVQVRIVQTSACAACKVAGYCNAAESKEKVIDWPASRGQHLWTSSCACTPMGLWHAVSHPRRRTFCRAQVDR